MGMAAAIRAPGRAPLLQVGKSAVATIAAWLLASWLVHGALPVFAAIAALLVVQPSLNQSLAKAIERTVGVIAGVLVASLLGIAFGGGTWVILASIVVALLLAWALKMTPGTSNQVAISAMLVLALGTATPGYAVDRIVETLIGAVVGFLVNIAIVPPLQVSPARDAVDRLGGELASSLERLADALDTAKTRVQLDEMLLQARLMRPMKDAADKAILAATDSLALNPRGAKRRIDLSATADRLALYGPMATQIIGMTRAVYDRYEQSVPADPALRAIATQLRRAAHDVRRDLPGATADDLTVEAEDPALTRPLVVSRPPEHWLLVGALLEDLRRIHEALTERAADVSG
ncbi:FUSC family protein [Microbacterium sp. ASV49]|uniref:Aromatic acid exporter family protein n=1 Tax=Microbacterium candidum TaxID=3041922 RepID=A0ABT7MZP0_9MICO|nr:FUSC family protein [Microbacterium sp. ASV49]MDL9979929.1 aromatic acid exporter family protein [Microbacterium sp. ASV49]